MFGIRRRITAALHGRERIESIPDGTMKSSNPIAVMDSSLSQGQFGDAARAASIELSVVMGASRDLDQGSKTFVPYSGEQQNDSARAKEKGKTLGIDQKECIGCGTCVENTAQVFYLNDNEGKAFVLSQEGNMELIQDAIDACPVTCISWR